MSCPPRPNVVSASSRPPLRFRGWPAWAWLTLGVACVATLVYEGYALFWLAFGVSTEHPAPENVAAVAGGARALTLFVLVPWLLAAVVLRPRLRILVAALVCASPAALFWWEVSQMR